MGFVSGDVTVLTHPVIASLAPLSTLRVKRGFFYFFLLRPLYGLPYKGQNSVALSGESTLRAINPSARQKTMPLAQ